MSARCLAVVRRSFRGWTGLHTRFRAYSTFTSHFHRKWHHIDIQHTAFTPFILVHELGVPKEHCDRSTRHTCSKSRTLCQWFTALYRDRSRCTYRPSLFSEAAIKQNNLGCNFSSASHSFSNWSTNASSKRRWRFLDDAHLNPSLANFGSPFWIQVLDLFNRPFYLV